MNAGDAIINPEIWTQACALEAARSDGLSYLSQCGAYFRSIRATVRKVYVSDDVWVKLLLARWAKNPSNDYSRICTETLNVAGVEIRRRKEHGR